MILETRGLTKRFGQFTAIDSLDFTVPEQETRAVIGPNGAGKTTLFDLISGWLPADEGEIYFHEKNITDWRPYQIANFIGRKFQITNIYENLTVWENLLVAEQAGEKGLLGSFRKHEPSDRIGEVLSIIGLESQTGVLPPTLAYGERQWLEVGMVLLNSPDILLLDEPTAGMSTDETRDTVSLIGDLGKEHTIIIVEHNIEFIYEVADTVTVLHQGQILAEGPPEAIANDERVKEVYIGEEL